MKVVNALVAVENVKTLIEIVFKSSLGITPEQVFSFDKVVTAKQADENMEFLYQKHMLAFKRRFIASEQSLYNFLAAYIFTP